MTVSREFLQAYLKAKGRKEAVYFRCKHCGVEREMDLEHPVKWLWGHAEMGHTPSVNFCHRWRRQVGQPIGFHPECEDWARWWWAEWNPKTKQFDLELEVTFRVVRRYENVEGYQFGGDSSREVQSQEDVRP